MHGKTMREALNEVRSFRDVATEGGPGSGPQKGGKKQSSADIKKAYGILNDPRYKQGNYSGAAKAIDKLSPGLSNHPDVKNAMKRANEELEEENRFSRQLKGRQREVYDLALKDIRKNKVYGEKDQDAVVDKVAGTSLMGKSLSDVKRAIQHESLDLSATGDTTTSNASQEDETVELDEAKLSTAQLDKLKQKYSGLRGSEKNGIQMDKLAKIMKRNPESMLDQLAALDIPMVSKVAKSMTEAVVGLPFSRTLMYIIKTDRNTATRIKSFLADNGERYPIHIDDNGSGQITLDAYEYTGGEKKAALAAAQAIAKKFNVKVHATR